MFFALFFLFTMGGYMLAMECERPQQSQYVPTLQDLSLDEKIGQLIMMATVFSSERSQEFMKKSVYTLDPSWAEKMVQEYHIGGIIFLRAGSPEERISSAKRLQSLSRYPLLISLDAEWGLSMRHEEGIITFPRTMTLGALNEADDELIYELGREIGYQCVATGIHINFAPVADVNNNPLNPVINMRSFGEDPKKVAHKAALFMRGMQSVGVMACAKHFPGHGDTETDSHHARGVITHDQQRLEKVELVPFKHLIDQGVDAIMPAHLDVPALSPDESMPATLSKNIMTKLLREQLEFDGLIITDALGMKGVTDGFVLGELELLALKAGNDILLCPVDVPRAIERLKQAVKSGELSEEEIDQHVERILNAKRKASCAMPYDLEALYPKAFDLKKRLYQAAVTVARDNNKAVPLITDKEVVVITFGEAQSFIETLKKQRKIKHKAFALDVSQAELDQYAFNEDAQIVISVHLQSHSGKIDMQIITEENRAYIGFIKKYLSRAILVLFGNPYNLQYFADASTVVVGYENEPEAQQAVADSLLGLYTPRGILPITPRGW